MGRPGQTIPAQGEVNLMSSSFGLGGNNFSLILSYDFD
jgi:3-oxoacyl-(acyl-carrier-protein) synthase